MKVPAGCGPSEEHQIDSAPTRWLRAVAAATLIAAGAIIVVSGAVPTVVVPSAPTPGAVSVTAP